MNQRYDCGAPVELRNVTLKTTGTLRRADDGSTLMANAHIPGGAAVVGEGGTRVGERGVLVAPLVGVAPLGRTVGKLVGVEPSGGGAVGRIIGIVGTGVTAEVTVIVTKASSLAPPDALNARTLNVCVPAVAVHFCARVNDV